MSLSDLCQKGFLLTGDKVLLSLESKHQKYGNQNLIPVILSRKML